MAIEVKVRERANVNIASRSRSAVNVSQRTGGGGGSVKLTPTAEINGSNVLFHFVTLAQMEKMHISITAGFIGFTLTKGEDDFELRFSADSPQEIAGQLVLDDSIDMVNDVFESVLVELPSSYEVRGVYIDGVDANLLESDINWRLADIQKRIGEKITPYLYDECSVEDIEHMFETTTEDGLIIVPSGLITPEGTMLLACSKQ